jgi:aspartyl-tRNA(Asn)/glutamyl-tRNA(Gln) amidotransferase subunit A
LKPTYGRVSRAGVTPLAWTLDHIGPLARSVEDVALLLGVLAGRDGADASSAQAAVPNYRAALDRPLRGTRIGVPRAFVGGAVEDDVGRGFAAALDELQRAGAVVSEVSLPSLVHAGAALGATIIAEACAGLRPLLGDRIDRVGPDTRVYLELGKLVSAQHYLAAQRLRSRLYDETLAVLNAVDILATPTTPLAAPEPTDFAVTIGGDDIGVVEALCRFTGPFNLTGLPALAVPCGFGSNGMPLGLQLVGRPFGEAPLLAVGHAWQRETDWHTRRPASLEPA